MMCFQLSENVHYLKVCVPWHHIGLALARGVLHPWREHQGPLQTLGQGHHTQQLVCLVAKPGKRFRQSRSGWTTIVGNHHTEIGYASLTSPCKGNIGGSPGMVHRNQTPQPAPIRQAESGQNNPSPKRHMQCFERYLLLCPFPIKAEKYSSESR